MTAPRGMPAVMTAPGSGLEPVPEAEMKQRLRALDWPYVTALTAFAIAMGHLEAVVVVYIRRILNLVPTPEHLDPALYAKLPAWLIATEQGREATTIIMLVSLAYLAGRTPLDRLGTFLFAFGVWDIWYYVALKILLGWPASLQTIDLLFLIPQPWFEPVWVPCTISAGMIAFALAIFSRSRDGRSGGGTPKTTRKK